jgi:hypothetical protein
MACTACSGKYNFCMDNIFSCFSIWKTVENRHIKRGNKVIQNIIISIIVIIAGIFAARRLIKGDCNCCKTKYKKDLNCQSKCTLKK